MMFCHGLEGEFWLMFIRVVTVSPMEILGPIIHREIWVCESGNGETTGLAGCRPLRHAGMPAATGYGYHRQIRSVARFNGI